MVSSRVTSWCTFLLPSHMLFSSRLNAVLLHPLCCLDENQLKQSTETIRQLAHLIQERSLVKEDYWKLCRQICKKDQCFLPNLSPGIRVRLWNISEFCFLLSFPKFVSEGLIFIGMVLQTSQPGASENVSIPDPSQASPNILQMVFGNYLKQRGSNSAVDVVKSCKKLPGLEWHLQA